MDYSLSPPAASQYKKVLYCLEEIFNFLLIGLLFLLPIAEIIQRQRGLPGIYGYSNYSVHLLFTIALMAGLMSQRNHLHLSLSLLPEKTPSALQSVLNLVKQFWAGAILVTVTLSSFSFINADIIDNKSVGILPAWIFLYLLPAALFLLTLRITFSNLESQPNPPALRWRLVLFGLSALFGWYLARHSLLQNQINNFYFSIDSLSSWEEIDFSLIDPIQNQRTEVISSIQTLAPWLIGISVLLFLAGMPIFITLAWISYGLFHLSGGDAMPLLITSEFYNFFTSDVNIIALPLFTLAGFILSESRSNIRMLRVLKPLCHRIPGGIGIIAILMSMFFTVITGASGVTILALGGILYKILSQAGYSKAFSIGLLTCSGSIGLLFPPSLPMMIYAIKAGISIKTFFLSGLLPGLLFSGSLILCTVLYHIWHSRRGTLNPSETADPEENPQRLLKSIVQASGELFLPVFIILAYLKFGVTLYEIAALTLLYVIILNFFIHRDISLSQLASIFRNIFSTLGGIFFIMGFVRSYSHHFLSFGLQDSILNYLNTYVGNENFFMLFANLILLLIGCVLDIFSAILIVSPIFNSAISQYDITAHQMGIVFLSNLEVGYITPPVGLSLFLASYRFNTPLKEIYRYIAPFFLILLTVVLLITYIPALANWLPGL